MNWAEIRIAYPEQWLVIEALDAKTTPDQQRLLKRIAVVERCASGSAAFERSRQLHQQYPIRELYYVHTGHEQLDIHEVHWLGVRRSHAAGVEDDLPI
jgi:hypothetical protein